MDSGSDAVSMDHLAGLSTGLCTEWLGLSHRIVCLIGPGLIIYPHM